jgi:hypothetical protein
LEALEFHYKFVIHPKSRTSHGRAASQATAADITPGIMLESFFSGFADISLFELILIAAMALIASVVGGVAGYGTGALLPLVLVPIMGAEPVVPILSLSALFTNSSRAAAFWRPCSPAAARRW